MSAPNRPLFPMELETAADCAGELATLLSTSDTLDGEECLAEGLAGWLNALITSVPDAPQPRPWWQTTDCPPWCLGSHHDAGDLRDDRYHYGPPEPATVALSLIPPVLRVGDGWSPAYAEVELEQHVAAVAPVVLVRVDGDPVVLRMTLAEAQELRGALAAMLAVAGGDDR